jgi:pyruvate kinase
MEPKFGISGRDAKAIEMALRHAAVLSISFARSAADVAMVLELLPPENEMPGVVVKIENEAAYRQCVPMLLEVMRRKEAGVLIARGDLAVECGFERLPAMQERILQFGRAARIPIFWATGVLERMTSKEKLRRSEMTDAASSLRADCVMLNRGRGLERGVHMLTEIAVQQRANQHPGINVGKTL